ncbi:MAG: Ig-like domain-containing protein, partial [Candidatus Tectomicrobia bacterium]|nr:Ig-like domain-containing protein [Candidatus Tectomicrobia bacterium]
MTFLTTQRQLLFILIGCFALGLGMASCGGGGGGGGGDQQAPPLEPSMVAIQGATHAGTPALPLALAQCRFVALQDGQQLDAAFANNLGTLTLQVPPGVQGFVRCNPSALPRLILSSFVSTRGQVAGTVLRNENVTPATTVIADHIEATKPADPQSSKVQLLNDLAMGEPAITTLVQATTLLYQEMLRAEIDSTADFSGESESTESGGDTDDGGAGGEAGDGGEFSPLPGAVCAFSLDLDGKVHANTVLADLYVDGRVDRLDLQAVAARVNGAHDAARRRDITEAFAALFPTGLGQSIPFIADDSNSATPGAYFVRYPVGVPGVIQCRPADQDNLVLTTCVPARRANEIFDGQDVTPVSTVVCRIVNEVQQAQVNADRVATQDALFTQLEPLRIFLSEDRNGNGIQDPDEFDKNGDGKFATIVEIESDVPLTEDNRRLALLASMSTTIFDTMRIEAENLPVDATFEEARNEFFTDGRFSEPLAALETGVVDTLDDTVNQAVLGTTDVVSAATTGSLRGTVMNESGQAVAGVQVVIFQFGAEVAVVGNPALTDADGGFRIDDIPVGETTVVAFLGELEVLRVTTNVVAIVTIDLEIMPTPEIQVSPSSLVFGDVEVGSDRILTVTLTNTGEADLIVDTLQVDNLAGSPFTWSGSFTLPVMISRRSSEVVDVVYTPAEGPVVGTLWVHSNAVNGAELPIPLSGTGVALPMPQLTVTPGSFTLSTVGATQQLQVTGEFSDGSTQDLTTDPSTTYDSDAPAVVSVDASGLVTAQSEGTATITIANSGVSTTATATVDIPAQL